jgi:adenine-specific DNA-methyltransferase
LPPNGIVLDFFAGSGTTGHAALALNNQDQGKRKFILCTNNENNICTHVCYPRLQKVLNGYRNGNGSNIVGFGGNLQYYRTSFVASEPTDRNKELLTKEAVEMLCLRENTFDLVSENDAIKIYRNKDHYTGIIFDQLSIPKFKKTTGKFDKPVSVYVFSLADDDFADEFADMKKVKVCSIPEAILRVYRRIFQ